LIELKRIIGNEERILPIALALEKSYDSSKNIKVFYFIFISFLN